MTRLVILLSVVTALSVSASSTPDAAAPCHRSKFETELVKTACARGGQPAAKDAMKQFAKDHHVQSCRHCHSSLAPTYDLKREGLAEFRKLGGT